MWENKNRIRFSTSYIPLSTSPKIMSLFEDAVAAAVKLPQDQREHLAAALGLKLQPSTPGAGANVGGTSLPMVSNYSPHTAQQWRKAESGHAVLANDETLRDDEIPAGAAAIDGIWQSRADQLLGDQLLSAQSAGAGSTPVPNRATELPAFAPALVHHDVAFALACGDHAARLFFENTQTEIRLATAGYLALLGACENASQQQRVRRFVQPFAVLSLGPMASSRAVELMLEYSRRSGLEPLDALAAATALAHEIPLVARDANRFAVIDGLATCQL
jgi:predicted nucleic acid-binding protein